jgi:hypothetical protein
MVGVDLRPMSIGEVLDRTFNLYKNNFWLFTGITALPSLVLLVIRVSTAAVQTAQVAHTRVPAGSVPPSPTAILSGVAAGIGFGLLYLLLLGYAQAATVFAVSDLYLGRRASVKESYARVGAKALRVVLILILVFLVAMVGFLFLIIPGIFLMCRTAVSVPASMLEDSNSVRSIERSMELTKGYAMQVFLIFLLVLSMSYVVTIIFQFPFMILAFAAMRAHQALSFGVTFLMHLSAFISEVLIGPIGTIAFSLMYYNLRVRKEAFDIQHLMTSLGTRPSPSAPSVA